MHHTLRRTALSLAAASMFCGCSRGPSPAPLPPVEPDKAAATALATLDRNGDGRLDAAELAGSPGLQEILKTLKSQEPGHADGLTREDITHRMEAWQRDPARIMDASYRVLLDNEPLADATVTFEPELCLGDAYKPYSGVTDKNGLVQIAGPVPNMPGLYVGIYRVRVSKLRDGHETIPARYNAATTLGREIAVHIGRNRSDTIIALKSR
jgi:hypothetical protein